MAQEYEDRLRLHNHQLALAAHSAKWRAMRDERERCMRRAEEEAIYKRRVASEAAQRRIAETQKKMKEQDARGRQTSRKAMSSTPHAAFSSQQGRLEYATLRTKSNARYMSPRSSKPMTPILPRPLFAPPE